MQRAFCSMLLCYRFDSHRVLFLFIRPLRWGHFCRLIQKYPKNRFLIRRIWKPNFPFAGEKGKYRLPMRLRAGRSSLTFKSEKIRLNSKLSVKIVRKQVYERTEFSFACCGFFGSVLLYLLVLEAFSFSSFSLCCRFDSHRVL